MVKGGMMEEIQGTESENHDFEELRFECDQLRQEMLHNDKIVLQILTAVLALTGVVVGVASSKDATEEVRIFLLYFLALVGLIALHQVIDRSRSTFFMASYLRTFVEPKTHNLKWETRQLVLRRRKPALAYGNFFNHNQFVYIFLIMTSSVFGGVFLIQTSSICFTVEIRVAIALISWMIVAALLYGARKNHNKFVLMHDRTFDPEWHEVKEKEVPIN